MLSRGRRLFRLVALIPIGLGAPVVILTLWGFGDKSLHQEWRNFWEGYWE